jgi:hypothetical protein
LNTSYQVRAFWDEQDLRGINERVELDNQIKLYQEACELIKDEEAHRRKRHQDDLKYQMMEKEQLKMLWIQ